MPSGANLAIYALMIFAGFCIPMMASLNAGFGVKIGNPFAAVSVLAFVILCTSLVVVSTQGGIPFSEFSNTPPHFFFAGMLFVIYITSVTVMAPRIGLANAIFFVLLGQMISATLIDHFGLFGSIKLQVTPKRLLGLAVMALGVWLARREVVG